MQEPVADHQKRRMIDNVWETVAAACATNSLHIDMARFRWPSVFGLRVAIQVTS